jgi:hypothetical protein
MAYFAQVSDNIVAEVIVVADEAIGGGLFPESEPLGQAFLAECGLQGTFLQCSETGAYRGAYPGPDWIWVAKSRTKDGGVFQAPVTPATS